jgi:hypothetical protein
MFGCYNYAMQRIPHAADLADRRDAPRAEVERRYSTTIDPCDGRKPITCIVLDHSVTGMQIELPAGENLPDRVQVLIGKLSHNGRVAWRDDNRAGINFVDEHHSIF